MVPAALIAAMLAYAFPFFKATLGIHVFTGLGAVFIGFVVLPLAPLWFAAFLLPFIAAFAGLMYQRRPGWIGAVAPLVCALVGFSALGSAYFGDPNESWAYGYYAAEGSLLVAVIASAVRLIRMRRSPAMWNAKAEPRDEPAASASQQLLARYRKG
jgi:hypothetical protein